MAPTFRIRPAGAGDGAFLADMVVEAANWRPGGDRPKHQVLTQSEHARYLSGWMRPGDVGFVAVDGAEQPVGAAWYRVFPRTDPGLAYIATGVPELIIGVRPIWRSHGVGRALLQHLCERAQADGHARLSLSVENGNFARTLYRSEGFVVTSSVPGRDTMVKRLR